MIQIDIHKKLSMEEKQPILVVKTEISSGDFVVVFGKSGAGKTSLLRAIAGLSIPEKGRIQFGEQIWLDTENKVNIPTQKRALGFVFQDLALFPNMTIKESLLFAAGKNKDDDYLNRLLRITGLESLSHRKPNALSGGQQQRAAIIRALARKPQLLLLDEPFSSLDLAMHNRLRNELKQLHKEFNLTTILVSHNVEDRYALANRIWEIEEGKIIKSEQLKEYSGENYPEEIGNEGKVLKTDKNGNGYIIEIQTGNTILRLPINTNDIAKLRPGTKVLVRSENLHLHIIPIT